MEWVALVAKDHKDWVKLVKTFGEDFYAEDIVQEAYLRLDRYCKPENVIQNGQVNKGFMYFVLRNLYLLHVKSEKKNEMVNLDNLPLLKDEPTNLPKEEAYARMLSKIYEEVDTWHWYDKQLFTIYKDTDLSIRDIAKETTISSSSIFNTLKNCKSKVKAKFKEDYEDYKNTDYELIK
jgi:DNA-directed RNA polymerase specialized sigma24 family protein